MQKDNAAGKSGNRPGEETDMVSHGRLTAYIHLDAVRFNMRSMKAGLAPDAKMIAVIKADAYGHGAVPIARLLEQEEYVRGFAVAAVSEARELRDAGVSRPILILGYTFEQDYEWMAKAGVRPTIFTTEMAEQFAAAARKAQVTAKVHAAVDTGMSRIGFDDSDESVEKIARIDQIPGISLEGIFTHFAKADETDKTAAMLQYSRFREFCGRLKEKLSHPVICHCANSAAIIDLPQTQMDLVRAGISIYGIYPSDEVDRSRTALRPVMELKSHVVCVKEIEPGVSVSYGGTFTAKRRTKVATIPVGYADGYPRSLSNKGSVLIHGRRADIIGRVCMDQFMADVTGMDVKVLDEVTLLGADGGQEITADELGALSGRFPYEFVCDIARRVPRVYVP